MMSRPLLRLSALGWGAWLATLAAVALLCAVIAYWAMQLLAPATPVAPAGQGPIARERTDLGLAPALFGTTAAPVAVAAPVLGNVQVLGVVAAASRGSAILIVDGRPPRSYAVGDLVGPGQRLREVRADKVTIDDNGRLAEVPAPARGSTAVLVSGAGRPRGDSPSARPPLPGAMPPGAMPQGAMPPGNPAPPVSTGAGMPPPGAMPAPAIIPTPGPMPGVTPAAPPALGKPGIPPA